jgi:hypothetical protein
MKRLIMLIIGWMWLQRVWGGPYTVAEMKEMYEHVVPVINHDSLAYRAAAIERMLQEASYFADQLKLPTPHPIKLSDIRHRYISLPWYGIILGSNYPDTIFGSNIYNSKIPLEPRLRALKLTARGTFETTNCYFSFYDGGKIREVKRIDEHSVERYARRLDELIGKPSLINEAQAHELATQWLAAIDVDVARLDKQKWTVNQLRYLALGATNPVTLPLYYVRFGTIHYTNGPANHREFDEPIVEVEILGTTKELQDLTINDLSFSRRPLLLITNALDLLRTPDPPTKHLERPPPVQTTPATTGVQHPK